MLRTLYAKLSVGLVVLLIAIGLVYAVISSVATRSYLEQVNQVFNRDLARNLVADRNLVREGRIDDKAIKETFRRYMVINPSIEIYLLDLDGRILSYSADPGKVKRNQVAVNPIRAFLSSKDLGPLLGDDPRSHDQQKAFSVTPVPSESAPEGYLYVVLRGQEFDSVEAMVRESYFLRLSAWSLGVSLIVGLMVGLWLFRRLTRRLQRLAEQMESFEHTHLNLGQTNQNANLSHGDEIGQLSASFERLAGRISEQIDLLNEKDAQRRQLVAQVSHDLRTPLASMQGHLETLQLKANSLPIEKRERFLQTAIAQGWHLSRLVSELFELSSLDAKEREPEREPFAAAELIYDVVQKHQLKAEQHNISLQVCADADLQMAHGDLALTERVLDNLIENAFAHTPDGGNIQVRLSFGTNQLKVDVADSGPGITDDALPHIFEPFYRAGEKTANRSHAGLGLAIAKRMMALQHGNLEVIDEPGQGAVFRFSLPLYQG